MVRPRQSLPALIALATITLLHAPGSAWADDPQAGPPPPMNPYPAPPGQAPVYLAPLAQQTQTTYVPQSVAMSGPGQITAVDDNQPPPAGYTTVFRKRKGLIVGGAVTLGATWGVCTLVAAAGQDDAHGGPNDFAAMWIPVAGPFLQMAKTDSAVGQVFLVGLGGAQLAGAIMLFSGMSTTRRVFVRNDLVSNLNIAPLAGRGNSGLALSGRF